MSLVRVEFAEALFGEKTGTRHGRQAHRNRLSTTSTRIGGVMSKSSLLSLATGATDRAVHAGHAHPSHERQPRMVQPTRRAPDAWICSVLTALGRVASMARWQCQSAHRSRRQLSAEVRERTNEPTSQSARGVPANDHRPDPRDRGSGL
jgi:hypothetical protein